MKYTKDEITLNNITPKGFENLCYDLLVNYNFENLIWRKGGSDNGRDIEGYFGFNNSISKVKTKWFFECKHYTKGVPPADLNSKIAWADAEKPDFLVFFISSYLTTGARTWLEKIAQSKNYKIITIEGDELKNRIVKLPKLIEEHFSLERHLNLFKNIKDFKIKFNITPSFEFLKEIIDNLDLSKLDIKDFGFILFNFYSQFRYFDSRNEHYGDFDESIIFPVLESLKSKVQNTQLKTFQEYKSDYTYLAGVGFLDEIENIQYYEDGDEIKQYSFQYYLLHLNHTKEREVWQTGEYLFVIHDDLAFELFETQDIEIRIINDFNSKKIEALSLDLPEFFSKTYGRYLEISKK